MKASFHCDFDEISESTATRQRLRDRCAGLQEIFLKIVVEESPNPGVRGVSMNRKTDMELLSAYANQKDEAAFAELLERYAGMVYATAQRRTGSVEAAHEITQSAFARLAVKAEKLIHHTCIGAWLHRATVLESKKHLRTERRHLRKMKALSEHSKTMVIEREWEHVGPVLDGAIEKLSAKDREIVFLRFIEGLEFREIRDRIGATEAACRKRLERALGKLHGFLQAHGSALTAAALASGLSAQFARSAPPVLMQGLCHSALSTSTQATSFNLITHILTMMTYSKTMTVAAVAAIALVPIGLQWKEIRNLKSQLRVHTEGSRSEANPSVLSIPKDSASDGLSVVPDTASELATRSDDHEEDIESFRDKLLRIMDDGASQVTADESLEFWKSVRTGKELDALIDELRTTVENNSEDIDSRLVLAQAYIAKVWGDAGGVLEQGLWAAKAEAMWKEVLEKEPNNWSAQRNIAFSYSQYPDFTNKTGDAIREYEKTVALQEASSEAGPGYSRTYLDLSKLYLKNGDPGSALATLEKGVAAHPESQSLSEQLQVINSSYRFE